MLDNGRKWMCLQELQKMSKNESSNIWDTFTETKSWDFSINNKKNPGNEEYRGHWECQIVLFYFFHGKELGIVAWWDYNKSILKSQLTAELAAKIS